MDFTYITSKQMTEVDKTAVKLGIPILKMMESAGKNLAEFVLKLKPKKVFILYGKGNNGGGGITAARFLKKKGIEVVVIAAEKRQRKNVYYQLKKLKTESSNIKEFLPQTGDVIIDALLGYNIRGTPDKNYLKLIKIANDSKKNNIKIVSLDVPTGINPDTGEKYTSYIQADYILTLALPKIGLKKMKNLYLVNICIGKKVYNALNIKIDNYFKCGNIVKVN